MKIGCPVLVIGLELKIKLLISAIGSKKLRFETYPANAAYRVFIGNIQPSFIPNLISGSTYWPGT
jgi:hypothetical protein